MTTTLPRTASAELRLDADQRPLSALQARVGRDKERDIRRPKDEQEEAHTDPKSVASHRGLGAVMPAPAAPSKGAFTNAP